MKTRTTKVDAGAIDRGWMAAFFSGLVCGEGNFCITIAKNPNTRLGYHVRPIFQVEMHETDKPLLELMHAFFGFGSIIHPKPRTRVVNESPTVKYVVTAINDCFRLADFFQQNPLIGSKQQSFDVWFECLSIIKTGRHNSSEGFREIVEARKGLNRIRRPSTFRTFDIPEDVPPVVVTGRKISSWTKDEEALVRRYVRGDMTRPDLDSLLLRDTASISNKIVRMRKRMGE